MVVQCKNYVVEHSQRLATLETKYKSIHLSINDINNNVRWLTRLMVLGLGALVIDLIRGVILGG